MRTDTKIFNCLVYSQLDLVLPKLKLALLGFLLSVAQPSMAADMTQAATTGDAGIVQSSAAQHDISDQGLMTAVQAKLAGDPMTSGFHLHVTAADGVVTLSGKVDTAAEADQAIQLAQSVPGVRDVNYAGLVALTSKQPLTDSAITAKVKGTFVREKLFGEKDISLTGVKVETTNGIVYLTGKVSTRQEADNAVSLARGVSGVKGVKSTLEVSPLS